jgi:predicted alpha/beta-hydrolase family hydrolase
MEAITSRLASRRIATLRYQFPYMESGRKVPDPPGVLEATVRAAVERAGNLARELGGGSPLPIFAGGKSMGGRMTSNAQARSPLDGVRGIAFLGFPLHPAKRPSSTRGVHLTDVNVPMLFLQGTRDALADLQLLAPLCEQLGERATLHIVEGADHGFRVLKRSGRTDEAVLDELAEEVREWMDGLMASRAESSAMG